MPEFNPNEPFETVEFDPSQAFTTEFDPSQPFTPEGGIEVIPAMQGPRLLGEEAPPFERAVGTVARAVLGPTAEILAESAVGATRRGKREEKFQQVQSRPPEWAAENFNRLQEALPFFGGGESGRKIAVEQAFGDRAALAFHEGLDEHVIKFDTGEIVPFDPAGIGEADIRGLRAPAGRLAAEVGAGAAGFLAGGPVGAALAAPLGAGAAEYRILKMGQEASGLSDSEIRIRAGTETLMAYAGEALFGVGGAVYRRILSSPQAKRFLVSITDDEIDEAIRIFESTQKKVAKRTGVKVEATTGQKLIAAEPDVGRKVQTFERGLEAAGEDVGRAARKTQKEAEEVLTKRLFGPAGDTADLGEVIQKVAAAEVGREAETIAEGSIAEQTEAIARREIDVAPTWETAEKARAAISDSRDKIFDNLGKEYDDFWARVPEDTPVDMTGLKTTASSWLAKLKRDIFPSLTKENKTLVKEALGRVVKEEPSGAVGFPTPSPAVPVAGAVVPPYTGPAGGAVTELTPMKEAATALDSVSRAISTLKAELRDMNTPLGAGKGREKKLLVNLIDNLEEARGVALEGVEQGMKDELNDIDRSYRIAKETLDLGMVNRLITKSKGGGFRIADTKFFTTILRTTSESKNIAALLASPELAPTGGLDIAKEGIMGFYRDQVVKGETTHAKFMAAYGDSLRQFYTPQEMRRFDSLAKAESFIKISEKREKELIKELKSSFEYKLGRYDPEDVLGKTAGKLTKTRKLKELLKNHPDKWRGYQQLRGLKLREDISSLDDVGDAFVDYGKLKKILGNKNKRAELTEVFGKQYVDDLDLLADIAKLRKVPKSVQSELTQALKETDSGPIMMSWRATFARPLSRPGLFTTAASKLYKSGNREATAKLLQNPEILREGMKLYNRNVPWKRWRRFWLNIGAIEFVRAVEEGLNE